MRSYHPSVPSFQLARRPLRDAIDTLDAKPAMPFISIKMLMREKPIAVPSCTEGLSLGARKIPEKMAWEREECVFILVQPVDRAREPRSRHLSQATDKNVTAGLRGGRSRVERKRQKLMED